MSRMASFMASQTNAATVRNMKTGAKLPSHHSDACPESSKHTTNPTTAVISNGRATKL